MEVGLAGVPGGPGGAAFRTFVNTYPHANVNTGFNESCVRTHARAYAIGRRVFLHAHVRVRVRKCTCVRLCLFVCV